MRRLSWMPARFHELKRNVRAPKKDLRRETHNCWLQFAFIVQWIMSAVASPRSFSAYMEMKTQNQRKHVSLSLHFSPSTDSSPLSLLQRMGPIQLSCWQLGTVHHSIRALLCGTVGGLEQLTKWIQLTGDKHHKQIQMLFSNTTSEETACLNLTWRE